MEETRLKSIIKTQIESAIGNDGGEISEARRRALEMYYSEPLGNEIEGQSEVVSSDVSDTIESILPDLMQIFSASDEIVRIEPETPADDASSKQATDMVNWIWARDNDGFSVLYDWFKDALLQINGFIKIYWDDTPHTSRHFYENKTEDEMALLEQEEGVEIIEHTETDGLHDIKIERTETKGRIRIENVPPEEFLIERRAKDIDSCNFCAHKVQKTISELLEMGFDEETVNGLPSGDANEFSEERVQRFNRDDEWPVDTDGPDESSRHVWVYECYVRLDDDDDGLSELRKITVAGTGYEVLDNEEADVIPFVSVTPIRMPHKFYGRSLAELVEDIQIMKTTLWRELNNNFYNINNSRTAVNERVDIEDYLNNRVAGLIRIDGEGPVSDAFSPVPTISIGNQIYPGLEYLDTVREMRTGITRYGQGLDPDSLNSTASGMNMILGRQQTRVLLIARVLSIGVRQAARKILKLFITHQDRARTIRLRDEWVDIDPREWNASMDATVSVGIGHGTQEQQQAGLMMILQAQDRIVNMQGGTDGPLVTLDNAYNGLAKMSEQAGYRNYEMFFSDPKKAPPAQPKPDPEMEKFQMEMQLDGAKAQNDVQIKQMEMEGRARLQEQELRQKGELAMLEFRLKAWQAEQDVGIEQKKFDMQAALEEIKAEREGEMAERKFQLDEKTSQHGQEMAEYRSGKKTVDTTVAETLEQSSTKLMEGVVHAMNAIAEQMKANGDVVRENNDIVRQMAAEISRPKEIVYRGGEPVGIRPAGNGSLN